MKGDARGAIDGNSHMHIRAIPWCYHRLSLLRTHTIGKKERCVGECHVRFRGRGELERHVEGREEENRVMFGSRGKWLKGNIY